MSIERLIVAIPACDEADRIVDCLTSVSAALDHTGRGGLIVVAADSCTDATERLVQREATHDPRIRLISGRWRSAGQARRAATDYGLADSRTGNERTWVATTDADSIVPTDWLTQQLALAEAGWVAVAGIVKLSGDETEAVRDHFARTYEIPDDGRHPHVHGANLGIRADVLESVGGWAPVALAEDHATWRRILAAGLPAISSTASWVWTSGRTIGRAAGGFADTLHTMVPGA